MKPDNDQDLLRNTIDSSLDMIQVFKAVRNDKREIIDFIWVLNNKAAEYYYGDVIGKSLLTLNPGVVEEGIFNTFKHVVETGMPDQSVRHYTHEQFDSWFLQSAVRQGDGVATTTKDISDIKKAEDQIRTSKERLQATLDSSPFVIQAFQANRDRNGTIVDFTWLFTNNNWNQQYGEMTGKSLLAENPGVIETGLFQKFVQVTEKGITIDHEQYYSHEQFHDQWFHQTLVKMDDGFVMNTEDITARKRAEQEIYEKQTLLESVLNNTESSIMLLKALRDNENQIVDFEYVYTNDQTLRSVERTSLAGKNMTEEFPELKSSDLLQKYIAVVETGESFKGEADINPVGYPVWAQVFAQKFTDGILVTYYDITERKSTEQQLIDSKELVQTVFDVTINPIAYHSAIRDLSGRIIDFKFQLENKKAREYSQGDRKGQRYSEAYPGIRDTIVFEKYCFVVETGNNLDTEVEISLRGRNHWFHLMAAKLGDGLVATAIDITGRKEADAEILGLKDAIAQQAEDKYRMLFNTIDQGFQLYEIIYDELGRPVDFRYLETNQAFERQTGLKDVAGKLGSEVIPNLESYWFDYFEEMLRSREPSRTENYNQATGRWYLVSSFRATGDGRPIIGALFNDITERKQNEEQQAFLLKLGDILRTQLSDGQAMQTAAMQLLAEHFDVMRAIYYEGEPDEDTFTLTARFEKDAVPIPDKLRLSDFSPTVADEYRTGKTQMMTNSEKEPLREAYQAIGLCAWLAVPFVKDGHLVSVVGLHSKTPRNWTDAEVMLLEQFAERVYPAVERARAEAALRRSEKRFQSIANLVPDLLWDSEPDGLTNWYNQRWLEYTGQPFEDAIRWGWLDAIHPDDREVSDRHYTEAVEQGEPLQQEHRIRRYDGAYRWFLVSTTPVKDENGKVIKMYGAATDIHDRKEAAEAVRESELQYRSRLENAVQDRTAELHQNRNLLQATLDSNLEMIQVFKAVRNGQGKIVDFTWLLINEAAEQTYGDVTGKSLLENDLSVVTATFDHFVRVVETGLPMQYEKHYAHEQVDSWFYQSVVKLDDGVATTTVNITERKKAEFQLNESRDQLQSILNTTLVQMSILHAVRDGQGNILDLEIRAVNNELEKETGRTDLVGKRYAAEYPGIRDTGLFDLIVKTIETGEPQGTEYFYPHEGFSKWFSCMFVKLDDGVVATNMDITSRKQAEEERFKNYLLLKQSEELAALGSWDYELSTKSFSWSDGMYRLFDLDKGSEIQPEIYVEYATEDGRPAAKRVVGHIQNGDSDFEETLELRVAGHLKVIHIKAGVVRNAEGKVERVLGVDLDISAMRAAEATIRKMEAEQQLEIFRVTLQTQEEERRRISESLHNGLGQMLYGIKMSLSQLNVRSAIENEAEYNEARRYTSDLLSEAMRDTRRISHELMPTVLQEFGLEAAIKDVCKQMQEGTRFNCVVELQRVKLDKYMQLAVFRTIQELMTNIVKHAEATEAKVIVQGSDGQIRLQVSDNGRGISKNNQGTDGIGLTSIRSKVDLLNGTVKIISKPDQGTDVKITLPYKPQIEDQGKPTAR